MARRTIYVESLIRCDINELWRVTQDPRVHPRWDLRFSSLEVVSDAEAGPTRFEYARSTPFHTVRGVGVNIGELERPDGTRTSALRFSTPDRLSPIRAGRGYWRYIPVPGGVRFVTGYDYEAGWGVLDIIFRPLLGWATAWSFDRMRIWLEGGPPPERWNGPAAVNPWNSARPRASRCLRAPRGGSRRDDHLATAPATLDALPSPKE